MVVRCTRPCARCAHHGRPSCEALLAGLRAEVAELEGRMRRHGEQVPCGEIVFDCACFWPRNSRFHPLKSSYGEVGR